MCLLLSAMADQETKSMLLTDKDAILTTLTIKAMNFGLHEDSFDDLPIASTRHRAPTNESHRGLLKNAINLLSFILPFYRHTEGDCQEGDEDFEFTFVCNQRLLHPVADGTG